MAGTNDSLATSSPQASDTIPVLAAVIERGGRYLVCLRPSTKRHGGLWEFPGGKLEAGETWEHAARRELDEELGVSVSAVGEPVFALQDEGSAYVITFVPVEVSGEARALEHDELRWLFAADMVELPLAPADRAFAEWLLREQYDVED